MGIVSINKSMNHGWITGLRGRSNFEKCFASSGLWNESNTKQVTCSKVFVCHRALRKFIKSPQKEFGCPVRIQAWVWNLELLSKFGIWNRNIIFCVWSVQRLRAIFGVFEHFWQFGHALYFATWQASNLPINQFCLCFDLDKSKPPHPVSNLHNMEIFFWGVFKVCPIENV